MNQENRKTGMKLESQETRNAGGTFALPLSPHKGGFPIQEFPGVRAFLIHLLAGTFGKVTSADIPARNLSLAILQPDLDSEYLADAILYCLDIARRELGLAIDLLDRASEFLIPEGIDPGAHFLAKLNVPSHGSGT